MMELITVNVHKDIRKTHLEFVKTSMNVGSITGVNTVAQTPLVDGHVHAQKDLLYVQMDAHAVFNVTNVTMLPPMKSATRSPWKPVHQTPMHVRLKFE